MMFIFLLSFITYILLLVKVGEFLSKKIKGMNKDILYIGIDPGVSGGIAILNNDGSVKDVVAMPETPRDILDFLSLYKETRDVLLRTLAMEYPVSHQRPLRLLLAITVNSRWLSLLLIFQQRR